MALILFVFTLLTTPMPSQVAQKCSTPISEVRLVEVLQETHVEVFGKQASKSRLSVAWAQIAFENGRGKITYNYNLGNIGPFRGYPYYKHGYSRFRSFNNFHEGARVYWQLMRDRCSAALASFDGMNAPQTARLLRRCGYHRADVDHYARGLGGLMWVGYRLQS